MSNKRAVKICLNLHVSLVDPERLAELNVGNEQGELAVKVQQENPEQIICYG